MNETISLLNNLSRFGFGGNRHYMDEAEVLGIIRTGLANNESALLSDERRNCFDEPKPVFSDNIKQIMLVVLFVAGATINLSAFEHMRHNAPSNCASGAILQMHTLKQHLNITDLLVVFVYGLSDLIWVYTYSWRANNVVCKLVQFGRAFAFYSSSNLIVCVAVSRLLAIISPLKHREYIAYRTHWLLLFAWLFAALSSLPQLWFWFVIEVPVCGHVKFMQCISHSETWLGQEKYKNYPKFEEEFWPWADPAYSIAHMTIMCWVPFGIIAVCYTWLMAVLLRADFVELKDATSCNGDRASAVPMNASVVVTVEMPDGTKSDPQLPDVIPLHQPAPTSTNVTVNSYDEAQRRRSAGIRRHRRVVALHVSLKLTVAYMLCYLPYNVVQTIKIVKGGKWYGDNMDMYFDCVNALLILNAVVNPLLYGTFAAAGSSPLVLGTAHRVQHFFLR